MTTKENPLLAVWNGLDRLLNRVEALEARPSARDVDDRVRGLAERVAVLEALIARQEAASKPRKRAGGAA